MFSEILISYHKKINDHVLMIKSYIRSIAYFLITGSLLKYIRHDSRILILIGNIETNPGSKHFFSRKGTKIWHWNLNRLSSHIFKKVNLLSAFTSLNKLEIICPQNLLLAPKRHLMTRIWKYLITTLLGKIIHLTLKVGEFAFIIKIQYLLNILM